ncbi:MAG: hypothetical protein ACI90V_007356 [Bacillariaceae sp.]|jgi:hypothetical protein
MRTRSIHDRSAIMISLPRISYTDTDTDTGTDTRKHKHKQK